MVATGQTSLMQGSRYGVAIDALVSQFTLGEIENAVIQAFEKEQPDIILIEGQSAVSHPAFMGSLAILRGSMPDGIILQHPPARQFRCDFPLLKMPSIESEVQLIEAISQSKVMAIALSHENLTNSQVDQTIEDYEDRFQLPTTDVLNYGCQKLVAALGDRFPQLNQIIKRKSLEIIVMVELGDLREGVLPGDLAQFIKKILALPHIKIIGLGCNLACYGGVKPDDRKMNELSELTKAIEQEFHIDLKIISGGNSANYEWYESTRGVGRIDNLRLGESILLGRETTNRKAIPGLYTSAFKVNADYDSIFFRLLAIDFDTIDNPIN